MKYYSAMTTGSNSSRHPIQKILIRDYLFGFFAFFGFLAASHALTPTLPIYLSRLGTVEGEIGVLVGTYGVASLLSRFCAGGLLRKYPERLVMLWGRSFSLRVSCPDRLSPFLALSCCQARSGFCFCLFRYGSHCIRHQDRPRGKPAEGDQLSPPRVASFLRYRRLSQRLHHQYVQLCRSPLWLRGPFPVRLSSLLETKAG